MYRIAAKGMFLGLLLLGGTACTRCVTTGSVEFSSVGGQSEKILYREGTAAPVPFPKLRGVIGCWASMGTWWATLTWNRPDLWFPTEVKACTPDCWQPGIPMGGC
jgi:hypothetical protein